MIIWQLGSYMILVFVYFTIFLTLWKLMRFYLEVFSQWSLLRCKKIILKQIDFLLIPLSLLHYIILILVLVIALRYKFIQLDKFRKLFLAGIIFTVSIGMMNSSYYFLTLNTQIPDFFVAIIITVIKNNDNENVRRE